MHLKSIVRFLVIAFLPAVGLQLFAISRGLEKSGRPWLLALMWVPALAAMTAGRDTRRAAMRMLRRAGGRMLLVGLAVGWIPVILRNALLWVTHTGEWNKANFPLSSGSDAIAGIVGMRMLLGQGAQSAAHFALNLALSVLAGSVLSAVIGALGEELGWRGVLQPALEQRVGPWKATLAVGAIWAYWHLPVNLAGYNDAAHPGLTASMLFPLSLIATSFGLGWITTRSQSVWPAALAHGAHNVASSVTLLQSNSWIAENVATLAGDLLIGLLFAWLVLRSRFRGSGAPASVLFPPLACPKC